MNVVKKNNLMSVSPLNDLVLISFFLLSGLQKNIETMCEEVVIFVFLSVKGETKSK